MADMPDDVVERIASFLPIKQAHKISILSTRFINSWRFCRDFSFDRNFANNLSKDEFKNIVNKFFYYHSNPEADRFRLYFNANDEIALVSHWLTRVVRLGINELELDFTPSGRMFLLSYDLINHESIKTVKLVNCELHLPVASNGLAHLRHLTFEHVRANPTIIHAIFVNCLSLISLQLIKCGSILDLKIRSLGSKSNFERLVVKNCSEVVSITINAPNLSTFHYKGKICEFKFENTELLKLNDVVIDIIYPRCYQVLSHRRSIMRSLAFVKSLSVSSTFLEGLCARFEKNEYRELEFCLWKLKEFHLVVSRESYINPSDIVSFLRKCPQIESVFIDLENNAFSKSIYWDFYGRKYLSDCGILFPFLNIVKVKGFTLKELPVAMVRFFLKNARYLQHLVLVKAKNHNFPHSITPECLRLEIPSSAKIEIFDYSSDKSVIT